MTVEEADDPVRDARAIRSGERGRGVLACLKQKYAEERTDDSMDVLATGDATSSQMRGALALVPDIDVEEHVRVLQQRPEVAAAASGWGE
eukprot:13343236-Alexandrium_andersonii.AAC.1